MQTRGVTATPKQLFPQWWHLKKSFHKCSPLQSHSGKQLWAFFSLSFPIFNLSPHTSASDGMFGTYFSDPVFLSDFHFCKPTYVCLRYNCYNSFFSLYLQWLCFPTDALGIFAALPSSATSWLQNGQQPPSIMPSQDIAKAWSRSIGAKNISPYILLLFHGGKFYLCRTPHSVSTVQNRVVYLLLITDIEAAGHDWLGPILGQIAGQAAFKTCFHLCPTCRDLQFNCSEVVPWH